MSISWSPLRQERLILVTAPGLKTIRTYAKAARTKRDRIKVSYKPRKWTLCKAFNAVIKLEQSNGEQQTPHSAKYDHSILKSSLACRAFLIESLFLPRYVWFSHAIHSLYSIAEHCFALLGWSHVEVSRFHTFIKQALIFLSYCLRLFDSWVTFIIFVLFLSLLEFLICASVHFSAPASFGSVVNSFFLCNDSSKRLLLIL